MWHAVLRNTTSDLVTSNVGTFEKQSVFTASCTQCSRCSMWRLECPQADEQWLTCIPDRCSVTLRCDCLLHSGHSRAHFSHGTLLPGVAADSPSHTCLRNNPENSTLHCETWCKRQTLPLRGSGHAVSDLSHCQVVARVSEHAASVCAFKTQGSELHP